MIDWFPGVRLRDFLATAVVATLAASAAGAQVQPPGDSARRTGDALVGFVVDAAAKPMEQVEVYIAGTDRTTRTDARGMWRFPNPPSGPRVVVARRTGYVPYVRELVVGSQGSDTLTLLLRRFPTRLSAVEVTARSTSAQADAADLAERLMQIRVGSGRLFTRDEILRMHPHSIAELIFGIPGIMITRTQNEIVATTTRAGAGVMTIEGQACQLQFYLDNTPISNEGVVTLDPTTFRSVEVYPQAVVLTGLAMRHDKCGAIVINTMRR